MRVLLVEDVVLSPRQVDNAAPIRRNKRRDWPAEVGTGCKRPGPLHLGVDQHIPLEGREVRVVLQASQEKGLLRARGLATRELHGLLLPSRGEVPLP